MLCSFVGAQLQNRETNLSRNQGNYFRQRMDQKCFPIQQLTHFKFSNLFLKSAKEDMNSKYILKATSRNLDNSSSRLTWITQKSWKR